MHTEGSARQSAPFSDVVTQDAVTQNAVTQNVIIQKKLAQKELAYKEVASQASTPSEGVRPDETQLSALQHLFHPQSLSPLSNRPERLKALFAAAFLVAVPVFIQAPLVRVFPWLSLAITGLWLWLGWTLFNRPGQKLWGDLVIGFSWTWLAGAVYWGWFRWEPLIHLPIESIGLPIVLVLMRYGKANIGNYFYLGSLFGTAITDIYFYCTNLIPYWRSLMASQPAEAPQILHSALMQMGTYQGVGFAIVLLSLLVMLGTIPLRTQSVRWWAFSGAVLSTILVDSLFFAAAIFA